MHELPMFPLGGVLFPEMLLPLHVFEPRYQALTRTVLAGNGTFGVTLITRGREVGGGDERSDVGTIARVVRARELGDGRWLLAARGTARIRVERWLDDAPYPRAEVVDLADAHDDPAVTAAWREVAPRLRTVLALAQRLRGEDAPVRVPLPDDASLSDEVSSPDDARHPCWQAPRLAPLGPLDAHRLLATDRCADRLRLLATMLDDIEAASIFLLGGEVS